MRTNDERITGSDCTTTDVLWWTDPHEALAAAASRPVLIEFWDPG